MANTIRQHNIEDEIEKQISPSKTMNSINQLTLDVEAFILAAAIGFGIARLIR